MNITVIPGCITVESISGKVEKDWFVLYLNLKEKHAVAEAVMSTTIALMGGPETLRYDEHDQAVPFGEAESATLVEIEGSWDVEVSVGRYSCQVIGIRHVNGEDLVPIPFSIGDP